MSHTGKEYFFVRPQIVQVPEHLLLLRTLLDHIQSPHKEVEFSSTASKATRCIPRKLLRYVLERLLLR